MSSKLTPTFLCKPPPTTSQQPPPSHLPLHVMVAIINYLLLSLLLRYTYQFSSLRCLLELATLRKRFTQLLYVRFILCLCDVNMLLIIIFVTKATLSCSSVKVCPRFYVLIEKCSQFHEYVSSFRSLFKRKFKK